MGADVLQGIGCVQEAGRVVQTDEQVRLTFAAPNERRSLARVDVDPAHRSLGESLEAHRHVRRRSRAEHIVKQAGEPQLEAVPVLLCAKVFMSFSMPNTSRLSVTPREASRLEHS